MGGSTRLSVAVLPESALTPRQPTKPYDLMASTLRRRIPLIFDGYGVSAGVAGGAYIGSRLLSSGGAASGAASVSGAGLGIASDADEVQLSDITVTAGAASGPWTLTPPSGYGEPFSVEVSGSNVALPTGFSISGSNLVYDEAASLTPGTTQHKIVATASASDAETDWLARISDTGVVWYHDFRSDAEANAFRWTNGYSGGNDPLSQGAHATYCRRITSDGIDAGGGVGCLEIVWPSSGQFGNSYWWRPLSPLTAASNGRGVDDPAANNTIARRTMVATDGGSQTAQFIYGYYGDPDAHADYPGQFDGEDYYLQVRVKMDPARITAGLNPGGNQFGKIFYLTRTDTSNTNQEINTESYQNGSAGRNYFSMYRSGSPPLENDTPGQGNQPGGAAGTVWFDNRDGSAANAFYWPVTAKWVTLLYYIKPMITETNATVVRVWKAVEGETTYTKIWDQTNIPLPYFNGKPFGHNALIFCSYQNQLVAANGFYHRMAQVIFKKGTGTGTLADGIPCPDDPVQRGEV